MDRFLVVYKYDNKKHWNIVLALNTLHAKDLVCQSLSDSYVEFIHVDYATDEDVEDFGVLNDK